MSNGGAWQDRRLFWAEQKERHAKQRAGFEKQSDREALLVTRYYLEDLKDDAAVRGRDFLEEADHHISSNLELSILAGDVTRQVILSNDDTGKLIRGALRRELARLDNLSAGPASLPEILRELQKVDIDAADKLAGCYNVNDYDVVFRVECDERNKEYVTHRSHRQRCWLRICPKCSKDIAQRLRVRYARRVETVTADTPKGWGLKHLVLTMRRGDDIRADIDTIHKATKKLIKHFWIRGAKSKAGAFGTVELGPQGGNVHSHVIVFGKFVEQEKISAYWEKLTGMPVTWIKAIGKDRAVGEGLKYITKLSKQTDSDGPADFELKPADLVALHMAMKGKRRAWAWGAFYGLDDDDQGGAVADAKAVEAADDEPAGGDSAFVIRAGALRDLLGLSGLFHLKSETKCMKFTQGEKNMARGAPPGWPEWSRW